MRNSIKTLIAGKAALAVALTAAMAATVPTTASAQTGRNIVNCDAPGGRQATGAVIGGVLGSAVGLHAALWVSAIGSFLGFLPVLLSPVRTLREIPEQAAGAWPRRCAARHWPRSWTSR